MGLFSISLCPQRERGSPQAHGPGGPQRERGSPQHTAEGSPINTIFLKRLYFNAPIALDLRSRLFDFRILPAIKTYPELGTWYSDMLCVAIFLSSNGLQTLPRYVPNVNGGPSAQD